MSYSLFSTITAFYILMLLYLPFSLPFIFSPVVFSTLILLLHLLRLGAAQTKESHPREIEEIIDSGSDHGPDLSPFSFVEWNVRAPLEVIYEEWEGEGNDDVFTETNAIQRYASLSLFYPESDDSSDGDSSSEGDWDMPEENMCFRWEDNLIEISLDEKKCGEVEEDNLIEIDLSPAIHI